MSTEIAIPEVIDAVEIQPPGNLFGAQNPAEVVERATATANALIQVVRNRNLIVRIGQSDHVKVEAWTLLGSMLGVFPVIEWTRKLEDGWEARCEAKTLTGATVGAAEAECLKSERNWKSSDDYAIRSMAQTRAVSKAMRAPLGFIVELAGFNPTPAEEMPLRESDGPGSKPSDSQSDRSVTKKAARERLGYALKDLAAIPLPPDITAFENWANFAVSVMQDRFGTAASKDLTVEQLDELTSYLRTFDDIPLTR